MAIIDTEPHRRATTSAPAVVHSGRTIQASGASRGWRSSIRSESSGLATRRSSSRPPDILASAYGPNSKNHARYNFAFGERTAHGWRKVFTRFPTEVVQPHHRSRQRPAHVRHRPAQLVGLEHVPPLGVQHVRPVAGIVQRRRPRRQDRAVRQRQRVQRLSHARTDCPLRRALATAPKSYVARERSVVVTACAGTASGHPPSAASRRCAGRPRCPATPGTRSPAGPRATTA